jgi:zinc protease
MRAILLGSAALLPFLTTSAATPAAAQPAAATASPEVPPIKFTERRLKNGLRVIAIRDTTTSNVMTSMWYEVGSKHDPEGRSGFAHLFEHILSRKTANMPYNAINAMVDDVGGSRNASTWYDRTNYYEIVPAEYLERMLWTHAERMARPVVDEEVFETERNVVKEELRQRVLAPPYGRLFNFAVGENVYNVTPHRRPTIGSISDLDSAKLADARAFHEAYYGPDTATLIVAGNFDPAKLSALVDRYFGGIPSRKTKLPLAITTRDKPIVARTVTATGPNVPLPLVGTAYQLPGEAHPDMAALEVLDAILSAGQHNRLDTALVKTGLATAIGTNFNDTEEESYLAPYAIVASGKSPEAVAPELEKVITVLRTTGPTADEVTEAKNELLATALSARETFSDRAFEFGERLVRSGDPRFVDKRLARIARVTPADVKRVAALYLNPRHELALRYVQGDGDAKGWANPTPMPKFRTVPAATGAENQLRPEAEREAPPAPGPKVPAVLPTPSDSRLSNGVRVIAARTGETPLATMTVLVRAGSATDSRAKAGRASLAAAIADKGTPTRTADQIATGFEKLGATFSANTDLDGTYLSVTAPTANLGAAADILADIVRNASFPDGDFARERKRAEDGLSVAMKDPGSLAGLLVQPVAYGDAPYGNVATGTPGSLAAMSRADLLEYRSQWWRPELATVVVSGGIDPASAQAISERVLGDWKASGAAPQLPASLAGSPRPGRTLVVDLPGAGQAAVYAFARGLKRSDPAFYDAAVANSALGGSSTGRLFVEVRVKRALSYGAYSSLASRLDEGTLVASAQTKNESAADVAKIFTDELGKIANQPLDAATLAQRRTLLIGSFQQQMESSAGFNGTLASFVARGLEPSEAVAYAQRIEATSGERATAAMANILKPDRISLVIVGDASKFIDKLRQMRPNLELVPADRIDLATAGSGPSPASDAPVAR